MNKADITVGMTFYMNVPDRRGNDSNEIRELTVDKVGNKYMEMSNGDRVTIETLKHEDHVYTQNEYKLYLTRQEIEDIWETNRLREKVRRLFFQYGVSHKIPVNQLKAIIEIIDGLD